jgi:two-component system, OmpR family, response regulator
VNILLVEDEQRISDFVKRGLKAEGYAVEIAANGRDALALAELGQFELVILDLGLPDIDGQEICKRLRQNGRDTPILMLTARDAVQDKVSGLRSGADDYMTKPFAFEELLARIEVLLRRRHPSQAGGKHAVEMQMADLILNRETHRVSRNSQSIELTPKEFVLLEYFLQSPGKVLSRTRILEHVWGYSADPLTNVVDVYIRQLRKKIDDDFELKLIKTVRGFGYKMDTGNSADF